MQRLINRFVGWYDRRHQPLPIGPLDDPTYYRRFVIPRNRWLNIYLHNFRHSDAEHLHDHRMFNISIQLVGRYQEERFLRMPVPGQPLPGTIIAPSDRITFRAAGLPHRVVLYRDLKGRDLPCWSLFIGFRHVRDWGFWCPGSGRAFWRSHLAYISSADPLAIGYGQRGRGCDE